MKSYQVKMQTVESEWEKYSELQVLKSAAGYYIGTTYDDGGFIEPGSRDSNYFSKPGEAEKALGLLIESAENLKHMDIFTITGNWIEMCKNRLNLVVYYRFEP